MPQSPMPKDRDGGSVSIVLEHLEIGCSTSRIIELHELRNASIPRGEGRLYFLLRGTVDLHFPPTANGQSGETRRVEQGAGFVVSGPATFGLAPITSKFDHVPHPAELLVGKVDYSAVEFPEEHRFLPAFWGGTLVRTAETRLRTADEIEQMQRDIHQHDSIRLLYSQVVVVELARMYLSGEVGAWQLSTAGETRIAFSVLLRDVQIRPMIGPLIQNLAFNWTSEELSEFMGFGRKALCARLRELCGTVPFDLLTVLRMQRASRLLAMPDVTLKEIPAFVGYRSLPAFASVFAKVSGLTLNESRLMRRANWSGEAPLQCDFLPRP